jgi:phosphate:Na+ symporter
MNARREIHKMAELVEEMFCMFLDVFHNPDKKMRREVENLKEMEDYTDQMQEQISQFLVECLRENLNAASAANVNAMIRIVDELESIGDSCYNLILLAERRYKKKMSVSKKELDEIMPFSSIVREFLAYNKDYLLMHPGKIDIEKAFELEKTINRIRRNLNKLSQKRLRKGSNVRAEILFIDIVKHIEHIGDFSLNISQALRGIKAP